MEKEKYLVIKGNEKEIDTLKEYILDYQEQTRELPSIKFESSLSNAYWKYTIREDLDCLHNIQATEEQLNMMVDEFNNNDTVWEEIDNSLQNFYNNTILDYSKIF